MDNLIPFLLWELSPFPSAVVCCYTMSYFLNISRRKTFALCLALAESICHAFFHLVPGLSHPEYLNSTLQVLLIFGSALLFSKSPLLHRLLAPALNIIITTLPEPLSLFVLLYVSSDSVDPTDYIAVASDPAALFLVRFSYFLLVCPLCLLGAQIWDRVVKKASGQILRPTFLFPLSQAIALLLATVLADIHLQSSQAPIYCAFLLAAALLCILADYYLFRSMRQLTEKAAAEERAGWFEYLLEQQHIYYEQYLSDLEDTSRIRHDIRNQLQTAYTLMAQHQDTKARAILDGISSTLDHQAVYCQNRVVNSVLSVKGNLFIQAGISFRFDCTLPDEIPLPEVTLCSLFTNVLDNAYHAVTLTPGVNQEIILSSYIKNGGFLLTCRNPVSPHTKQLPSQDQQQQAISTGQRHGLGLSILQNIADTHNGTMRVDISEATFCIQLFLHLE
ncbi:MAG: GHKL domain-containing protein [Eubacteriaceae bacterium]|nr:GHKL domain-containing protein [Eubacteriaceae bacterium]